jgi:lysophospholipase L1-like esterase
MTRTLFLTLALATSLQAESPKAPQPAAATAPTTPLPENLATHPLPRDEKWMEKHLAFNATSKEGKAELVFLGDSITQGWLGRGKASWEIMYDFLHLTDKGYELYASAIEADVKALLGK